jgi:hypothetical protein
MRDVLILLLPVGFFALASAYVRACGAVVGPEVPRAGEPDDETDETEMTA